VEDRGRRRFTVLPEMEGKAARRYAALRGSGRQIEEYRKRASELAAGLPGAARVLEVAPGPGYQAIELARLGCQVTGLDISRTMVDIANENARTAAVNVDVRHGDVLTMPFDGDSFDLVVCQAAFKNFSRPRGALDEMYRVLRPGGLAVIEDMRGDATRSDIQKEVRGMELSRQSAFMTRAILTMLRRRAYTPAQFERLAAESAFQTTAVQIEGIGMTARLKKKDATIS
jgi:ubiquinone/menaquinone biosynthesis C-methylase UbiE